MLGCLSSCSGSKSGEAAHLYVTDTVAKSLAFEIDYVTGRTPNAQSVAGLVDRLTALNGTGHMRKPGGVTATNDDAIPAHTEANHAYTSGELAALVSANKDMHSEGTVAAAYVLYVDGHHTDDGPDGKVLGLAYGGDRIVMFKDTITAACESLLPLVRDRVCALAEASVLVHEFGHLMGLVNNGLPMAMNHQDTAHGAHDVKQDCIMYWTVNSSASVAALADYVGGGGTDVAPFDSACLADLAAAQSP